MLLSQTKKPSDVESARGLDAHRFVTITFDDGLIAGARKAVRILDEFTISATFYLVTGWVRPRQVAWIRDHWNKGRDHGHWRDWREIQSRGHDFGSHTVTHLNAGGKWARRFPVLLRWEFSRSHADLRRQLGVAPVSISMPWNTPTETLEPYVRRFYAACRLGSQAPRANDLARMNWHRLHSWAPDSDIDADEIIDHIRATPPGHWLILQFHSFDGEGYMPVTSDKFREILRGIAATNDLQHVTVSEMVRHFRAGTLPPRNGKPPRRRKARICLVTSEHLSMNPRLVKEADALHGAGYDVRVVSCQWMEWQQREDARLLETRYWRNQTIDFSPRRSPRLFWYSRVRHYSARRFVAPMMPSDAVLQRAIGRVVPEMVRLAATEPADLFVGHNIAALPAAVLAARERGVRAAFDAEDFHSGMWVTELGPTPTDRLAGRVERRFLPQCAYVTAASPGIAEAYAQRHGIPLPTTIRNVFPLADRPGKFRLHDAKAPLTLYWFSQVIGARRGLEEIIRGIALAGSKNIQLHLRGQWQPGYRDTLNQLARKAGLDPTQLVSHDLAPPDDMIRLSAEYDVGLALEHPVSENRDICLTNKICTYLLAGNAVIATATRGQKRLMEEIPGTGLCYEIGDLQTVARQLTEWVCDRAALERVRRCAWGLGERSHNWDVEQQKLVPLVERVVGAARKALA